MILILGCSAFQASVGEGAAPDGPPRVEYAIAIHGGAGVEPDKLSPERKAAYEKSLTAALRAGQKILAGGGTSLEAVERVIRLLEDDPLFNAGKGAVYNSVGGHELDASIMDGRTKACGAVAGVRRVKNPITLARLVMTETRHVLLAGEGADEFARSLEDREGVELVENAYFSTPERRDEWQKARSRETERRGDRETERQSEGEKPRRGNASGRAKPPNAAGPELSTLNPQLSTPHGTVGCVALDRHGNLAAGTSTGGLTNKRFGRIGDSPIVGAGTYADNGTCAVSCTGTGEHFIRNAVAFRVAALIEFRGLPLDEAVRQVIFKTLQPDVGGLIALGRDGSISMHTNTPGLARAAADSTGRFEVQLGK
ncbi:MAG TPA: isoaspartyl peptidase/L-asparaginase [Planctomycetaceae bacterium]|nr:isoaspartyl peptidase/L-asparaginase [Planctomycetaceae bacterium]